jgi:hypothetical protein
MEKNESTMVSLKQFSLPQKIFLLQELGYQASGKLIVDKFGEIVTDRYLGTPVELDNMVILPGSTIILDDNELSISLYIDEYGDPFQ